MLYKKVKLPSIKEKITVREDGGEIIYKGKLLHFNLVKNKKQRKGYYQVSVEGKGLYVHRLVGEAFVPNTKPVANKLILHKDCDTLNNHYRNLEWGNSKKIIQNRIQNANKKYSLEYGSAYRSNSKISHEEAIKIAKRLENGEYAKDICLEYNVSEMSIARIRKRYVKKPASIRYSIEVKQTVLNLLKKYKPHELVSVTGLKYHTLYRWSKESTQK